VFKYFDNAYAFTQTGGNFEQLRVLYNRALCKASVLKDLTCAKQ